MNTVSIIFIIFGFIQRVSCWLTTSCKNVPGTIQVSSICIGGPRGGFGDEDLGLGPYSGRGMSVGCGVEAGINIREQGAMCFSLVIF